MNKAQLIDTLSDRLGSRRAANEAVDAVIDTITRAVSSGERVAITGFGVFEKVARPARTGRNPRTGESVKIKKTSVPKFKAGQSFKDVVSGAKSLPRVAASAVSAAAGAATGAKKSTAKKSTAKKSTAKKSTAKKSPAKKSAAKKSTASRQPAARWRRSRPRRPPSVRPPRPWRARARPRRRPSAPPSASPTAPARPRQVSREGAATAVGRLLSHPLGFPAGRSLRRSESAAVRHGGDRQERHPGVLAAAGDLDPHPLP